MTRIREEEDQQQNNIEAVNDYPPIRFEIRFERKFPIRRSLPYEVVREEERVLPHLTRKERDERYDEKNQLMTVPWNWKPKQDDRRVRRMV